MAPGLKRWFVSFLFDATEWSIFWLQITITDRAAVLTDNVALDATLLSYARLLCNTEDQNCRIGPTLSKAVLCAQFFKLFFF